MSVYRPEPATFQSLIIQWCRGGGGIKGAVARPKFLAVGKTLFKNVRPKMQKLANKPHLEKFAPPEFLACQKVAANFFSCCPKKQKLGLRRPILGEFGARIEIPSTRNCFCQKIAQLFVPATMFFDARRH